MTNPVLVEVTRGERVESRHRGAVAILDADGKAVFVLGDIEAPVYPRSAVKAMQALPLVESGAADAFGFGARELALAQASHGGEPRHVAGVSAMLAAIGLDEAALECGAHMPTHAPSAAELIRRGKEPKPAAQQLLRQARQFPRGLRAISASTITAMSAPRHPVQELVREALEALTGAPHATERLRHGRMLDPHLCGAARGPGAGLCAASAPASGLPPQRAEAARRIYAGGGARAVSTSPGPGGSAPR